MKMNIKNGENQEGKNNEGQGNTSEENNKQVENDGNSENQSDKANKNTEQENKQGQDGEKKERKFIDDHSLWEEAFQEREEGSKTEKKQAKTSNKSEKSEEKASEQPFESKSDDIKFEVDEKSEFEKNRDEKLERVKNRFEKTKRRIRGEQIPDENINLGNIGESKNEIDWRLLLRKEVEKSETIWSQRRSIAENNYAYRLEENDVQEGAETEVMIDASGSVNIELIKAFLRELKPLIKESKLKVACFNTEVDYFRDIKSEKDIDAFSITQRMREAGYATDLDLPVREFSKKTEINKIVFTDGFPTSGMMPKEDLKKENVIWLVYGNENFHPCCGKVINITQKQLEKLNHLYKEQEEER